MTCGTSKTPPGWACTRELGHEGPCAAWPTSPMSGQEQILAEMRRDDAILDAAAAYREACVAVAPLWSALVGAALDLEHPAPRASARVAYVEATNVVRETKETLLALVRDGASEVGA